MEDCCNPCGYDRTFGPRFPRRVAKHYRNHGLDKPARRMVAFLEQRGIDGATVLEVGGGVGEIQIELLKQGAAQAINLELVPSYDPEAQRLLRRRGSRCGPNVVCTTSPSIRGVSSRQMWSCFTGWCVAGRHARRTR
jgi:hypothetical protein